MPGSPASGVRNTTVRTIGRHPQEDFCYSRGEGHREKVSKSWCPETKNMKKSSSRECGQERLFDRGDMYLSPEGQPGSGGEAEIEPELETWGRCELSLGSWSVYCSSYTAAPTLGLLQNNWRHSFFFFSTYSNQPPPHSHFTFKHVKSSSHIYFSSM